MASPIDLLLLTKSVPHVVRKIFLSVDPADLDSCRRVCKSWLRAIDEHILKIPRYRKKVMAKKMLKLWTEENFMEHKLEQKGLEWWRLDIETVCCSGRDIFLAASDRLLQFRELKLRKVFRMPEGDKVRNFYAGKNVLLATLNQGHSYLVVERESLTLKAARIRFRVPLDSGNLHVEKGIIHTLRSEFDFVRVGAFDDDGAETELSTYTRQDMSPGPEVDIDLGTSAIIHNCGRVLVGHTCGTIDVFNVDDPSHRRISGKYSDLSDNYIKRSVLTDSYFGAVYSLAEQSTVGFCLFSTTDGSRLFESASSDIQVYGRSHVSATSTMFVFSYSDALHNQHFLVHDLGDKLARPQTGKVLTRSFTLYDRTHPMRSMQILSNRVMALSFYRTGSAFNIFDLESVLRQDNFDPDKEERLLKLPTGIMAFTSEADVCHSQKMVLYRDAGVLCQRLDPRSGEVIVFALKFVGRGGHHYHQQQQQQQNMSSAAFLGALSNGLNSKLGKFRAMSEQMKKRPWPASHRHRN